MSASERLTELDIELPATPVSLGAYAPAKRVGTQVFTSGQLPIDLDGNIITGRLGADVDLDSGKQAARLAILRALSAVVSVAGTIDAIREVVRVCVFVNSTPEFTDQALVANGASELLIELFGEEGRHVRSAVGVAVLPANAAVEVELVVEAARKPPRSKSSSCCARPTRTRAASSTSRVRSSCWSLRCCRPSRPMSG